MTDDWREAAREHAEGWNATPHADPSEGGPWPTEPPEGQRCEGCYSFRAKSEIVEEDYCKDELSPWPIAHVGRDWWCCFWQPRKRVSAPAEPVPAP